VTEVVPPYLQYLLKSGVQWPQFVESWSWLVAKAASTEFGETRGRVLFLRTGLIHERDEIAGTRLNRAGVDKRRKGSGLKPGPAWPEMRQLTRRATDLCRFCILHTGRASHHPHVLGYVLASVEFHLQQIDMVFGVRVIAGDAYFVSDVVRNRLRKGTLLIDIVQTVFRACHTWTAWRRPPCIPGL